MTIKQVAAAVAVIAGIVGPLYGLYTWLDSTLVTKKSQAVADLRLLMEIQHNRITMFELQGESLDPRHKLELEGLRRAHKANECEQNKLVGLFTADHNCAAQ